MLRTNSVLLADLSVLFKSFKTEAKAKETTKIARAHAHILHRGNYTDPPAWTGTNSKHVPAERR